MKYWRLIALVVLCAGSSVSNSEDGFDLNDYLYSEAGPNWNTNARILLTDILGLEAFYQELGQAVYSLDQREVISDLNGYGAAVTSTFGLSKNVDMTFRAGLMKWESVHENDWQKYHNQQSGSDFYYGFSVGYSLSEMLDLMEDIRLVGRIDRLENRKKRDLFGMVYGLGLRYDF